MSQILVVLSAEQLTRMLGFWGSKTIRMTQYSCPLNDDRKVPVPESHTLHLQSDEPVTRMLVSFGLSCLMKARHLTSCNFIK